MKYSSLDFTSFLGARMNIKPLPKIIQDNWQIFCEARNFPSQPKFNNTHWAGPAFFVCATAIGDLMWQMHKTGQSQHADAPELFLVIAIASVISGAASLVAWLVAKKKVEQAQDAYSMAPELVNIILADHRAGLLTELIGWDQALERAIVTSDTYVLLKKSDGTTDYILRDRFQQHIDTRAAALAESFDTNGSLGNRLSSEGTTITTTPNEARELVQDRLLQTDAMQEISPSALKRGQTS